MTKFSDSLNALADQGQQAYARVDAPQSYARDYVRSLRGVRRRRAVMTGAMSVVLLGAATLGAVQLLAPRLVDPAVPALPGAVVWATELGSESWSSPVVVGESVVVGANDGVVRSVDVETGTVEWEFATGGAVRGTPVAHGEMVYVASDDGGLYALDSSGELQWRAQVGQELRVRDVYDPYASGPAVVAGLVVVGGIGDPHVYAVDALTGALEWTFATRALVTTNIAASEDMVFVGSQDTNFYALDAATGVEVWSQPMGGIIMSQPATADGVVVVGSRGTEVVGFDAVSGERLWSVSMGQSWAESSVHIDASVAYFGSSAAGEVVGADLATGEVVWRSHIGGWPWARPTAAGATVYATAGRTVEHQPWEYAVYALDKDTGNVVWRASTGAALDWRPAGDAYGAMTAPALTESLVIVAGLDGVLYAFAR